MRIDCPICGRHFRVTASRLKRSDSAPTCSFACREEAQRRVIEQKLSQWLGEPLEQFLRRRYEEGATLKQLGEAVGRDSTQLLRVWFPRYGIQTRPRPSGNVRGGMTDKSSAAYQQNIERMRTRNPGRNSALREVMAEHCAAVWRRNPSNHEAAVITVLCRAGVIFRFQHRIGRYISDFFLPTANLLLEVDAWRGEDRVRRAARRDAVLKGFGYEVIRVRYGKRPELTAKAVIALLKDRNLIPGRQSA